MAQHQGPVHLGNVRLQPQIPFHPPPGILEWNAAQPQSQWLAIAVVMHQLLIAGFAAAALFTQSGDDQQIGCRPHQKFTGHLADHLLLSIAEKLLKGGVDPANAPFEVIATDAVAGVIQQLIQQAFGFLAIGGPGSARHGAKRCGVTHWRILSRLLCDPGWMTCRASGLGELPAPACRILGTSMRPMSQ